jgi:hypothetical protein
LLTGDTAGDINQNHSSGKRQRVEPWLDFFFFVHIGGAILTGLAQYYAPFLIGGVLLFLLMTRR